MEEVEVKVEVIRLGEKSLKIKVGETVESVVKRIGLNPSEYVAVLNGRVVPDDKAIENPSHLKLIPVVSGG
ncbi:MAG: MoaD/ThiS family protein [Thermofilaceae archaeon]